MVNVSAPTRAAKPRLSTRRLVVSKLLEYLVIFVIGGLAYVGIECLWRGHSHWTMFILGGLCTVIVGGLNEGLFPKNFGIVPQALMGAVIITVLEFITGCIVNLWLGWDVWDYSDMPFNILGQVCLLYTVFWFILSIVIIYVDDWLRHVLFGEPLPQYKIWMNHDCANHAAIPTLTPKDKE